MENSFSTQSLDGFTGALASSAPAPGGGAAAALCGALAAALGAMVGNLTIGKEKYAANEPRLRELGERVEALRLEFLALADEDAAAYMRLSKTLGLPKDSPGRAELLESGLLGAAEPPMKVLRLSAEMIRLSVEYAELGSTRMLSDVGCAAALAAAAARSAALNVLANTSWMKDAAHSEPLQREMEALLSEALPLADRVYRHVAEALQ